jgi:glycosyltransferase involved in cell wall biosynthesis
MRKLGEIVKDNKIHVVNAHHFISMVYSYYGCKIRNAAKLIYTEHSKWEIERLRWKWRRIGSYLLSRSDAGVGVSIEVTEAMKDAFKLKSTNTFVIQNGIDLQAFDRICSNGAQKKRGSGIARGDKAIGIVANFRKVKNHIFLLRAFEAVAKEYQNVKLLVIGQGFEGDPENSEGDVRNFINDAELQNKVFLLGFRTDILKLLSNMDIFCLTSFREGLPISLIEAMAAGLPVVGTDVEGIRDVIIHSENGFLVPVGDVKGLKDALITLLQNDSLRKEMGRKSRALASQAYSLHHCVNRYQDLFTLVVNQ